MTPYSAVANDLAPGYKCLCISITRLLTAPNAMPIWSILDARIHPCLVCSYNHHLDIDIDIDIFLFLLSRPQAHSAHFETLIKLSSVVWSYLWFSKSSSLIFQYMYHIAVACLFQGSQHSAERGHSSHTARHGRGGGTPSHGWQVHTHTLWRGQQERVSIIVCIIVIYKCISMSKQ